MSQILSATGFNVFIWSLSQNQVLALIITLIIINCWMNFHLIINIIIILIDMHGPNNSFIFTISLTMKIFLAKFKLSSQRLDNSNMISRSLCQCLFSFKQLLQRSLNIHSVMRVMTILLTAPLKRKLVLRRVLLRKLLKCYLMMKVCSFQHLLKYIIDLSGRLECIFSSLIMM